MKKTLKVLMMLGCFPMMLSAKEYKKSESLSLDKGWEVVHLHYDDISRTNMTIHVRETKGRIDRYTILSQKNFDLLTEYWYKCGRPKNEVL